MTGMVKVTFRALMGAQETLGVIATRPEMIPLQGDTIDFEGITGKIYRKYHVYCRHWDFMENGRPTCTICVQSEEAVVAEYESEMRADDDGEDWLRDHKDQYGD